MKETLTCDTLFDALIRAGKRVAIATVAESSMEALFQGRRIDLFPEACDEGVTDCTLGLIEAERHELIVAYHQEYDDTLHEKDLQSPGALARELELGESLLVCSIHSGRVSALSGTPGNGSQH